MGVVGADVLGGPQSESNENIVFPRLRCARRSHPTIIATFTCVNQPPSFDFDFPRGLAFPCCDRLRHLHHVRPVRGSISPRRVPESKQTSTPHLTVKSIYGLGRAHIWTTPSQYMDSGRARQGGCPCEDWHSRANVQCTKHATRGEPRVACLTLETGLALSSPSPARSGACRIQTPHQAFPSAPSPEPSSP